ncbi:MAG: hypothetical protein K0R54_5807 [Clostridiaceae bacterium]|jgi:hypothetical protein|nr:hypothetical protein [Clostridiaceae bacterium]MDF2951047.1 hypothetical protein [Anaerocolumna sp.]
MAFDINNFIIDRPIRAIMSSSDTGDVLWSINQIEDPSISCASEATQAVDMLGSPIMEFERAKTATFSATNSLFDLGLAAAQFGTTKKVANASNKVTAPKFETLDVDGTTVTLSQTPTADITAIYVLKGDNTLGTKYVAGATASATEFVYDDVTKTITLPTSVTSGKVFVKYEYETENAVEVVNTAVNFPTAGQLVVEVLGCDVCNKSVLYYAYLIFPAAKLSSSVDLTFTTEGKHPFEISCFQDYCDYEKRLFSIVIPQA